MKKVLGRGLDSLIPEESGSQQVRMIKTAEITPNRYQMRTRFEDGKIDELASTIKENGVFQPLVVRPENGRYMLVAGERRLRAARKAGLEEVPCIEKDVDDDSALILSLIENIQRENLSPVEEASAYERMSEEFSMSQKEIAARVGKSRSAVANIMRLLTLPEELIDLVAEGSISAGHARALLAVPDPEKRRRLAGRIVREKLTVRETESLASSMTGKKKKPGRRKSGSADGETAKMEDKLEKALGTKVRIKLKKSKGSGDTEGTLLIDFYSLEDFERISDKICGSSGS